MSRTDINDDHGFPKFGELCYYSGIPLWKYIDREKIYGIGNILVLVDHPSVFVVIVKDCSIEYSLEDELRLGLLQDIDNFVIGEIKGGEALYVFTTAMSTGARFFGTIHANTAAGSVVRLAQCARYISDYSMETLEEMLTVVPFVLIHMSRFAIDEILEIAGGMNGIKS